MASPCVVVVDPYSTGCCLALECFKRGYGVIALWSCGASEEMKLHKPRSCDELIYVAEVSEKSTLKATVDIVLAAAAERKVYAVMVGGDSGVPLADALSETLGLRTNGAQMQNRRDKKLQQELVKAAGLRSVRQACGTKLCEIQEFLRNERMPVVVKPVESAGSDGVKLCHSIEEAETHFQLLMKSQQRVGAQGAAVLCQEFLKGKEYVIDCVSCDGVHKTVMVWVYDKREANGAAFVYHGMLPVRSDAREAKLLIPYVRGVLDALQIKHGPTHAEVMLTQDGPCLVEMNCRAHGGDGGWLPLARRLTGGYSQVDAAVDSFLNVEAFSKLPDVPPSPFKAAGQEVILVSFTQGTVTATPGYDRIRALKSCVHLEESVKVGSKIERSVDLFTNVGNVILIHADADVLNKDVAAIRAMEKDHTMFELIEHSMLLGRSRLERSRSDGYVNEMDKGATRTRAMSDSEQELFMQDVIGRRELDLSPLTHGRRLVVRAF